MAPRLVSHEVVDPRGDVLRPASPGEDELEESYDSDEDEDEELSNSSPPHRLGSNEPRRGGRHGIRRRRRAVDPLPAVVQRHAAAEGVGGPRRAATDGGVDHYKFLNPSLLASCLWGLFISSTASRYPNSASAYCALVAWPSLNMFLMIISECS